MGTEKKLSAENLIPENLVISSGSFLSLLDTLVTNFGSAGESMVFQMGHENGMIFCRDVMGHVNHEDEPLEALFNMVLAEATHVGWANMVVEEFNPQTGNIKVVLQNNAFKNYCIRPNMPQCFFLRGYLSGIIKELTNMDYMFSRSECYSLGDEHCSIKLIADVS